MSEFNEGKPFHGSSVVSGGSLRGATDTDYFYWTCPQCPGEEMLRILDFKVVQDGPVQYAPEARRDAKRDFIIAFHIKCHNCGLTDFVKVSNIGWQGGQLSADKGKK